MRPIAVFLVPLIIMPEVVITYLQMTSPAQLRARRSQDAAFVVREAKKPQFELNRFLYLLVGGAWSWNDKREWSNQAWQEYVTTEKLRTFVAFLEGNIAGYYELRREEDGAVEIAYFGLARDYIGRGYGAALLTDAIERAWSWDARRVWVHTCTLDHEAALKNYEARGMVVYDHEVRQADA